MAAGYLEAIYDTDVTDLVDEIRAPALVLHYRGDRVIPFAGGEALAAALPSARFVAKDGAWHLPDARDVGDIIDAVEDLLSRSCSLRHGERRRERASRCCACTPSDDPWSPEMTAPAHLARPEPLRRPHPVRAWANAKFFESMDWYLHRRLGARKRALLRRPAPTVVELGSGAGASMRYLAPGTRLIAIEPNPHTHDALRRNAARYGIDLEIRERTCRVDRPRDGRASTR